jgi:hypothetical protein
VPDQNGHTSQNLGDPAVGNSCSSGRHTDPNNEIHPFVAHYQTWNGPDAACDPAGTTGDWNAASGRSNGWQDWSIDLSAYAGNHVEVSTEAGTESFETGLGAWVAGPASVARFSGPVPKRATRCARSVWSLKAVRRSHAPVPYSWRTRPGKHSSHGTAVGSRFSSAANGPVTTFDASRSQEHFVHFVVGVDRPSSRIWSVCCSR